MKDQLGITESNVQFTFQFVQLTLFLALKFSKSLFICIEFQINTMNKMKTKLIIVWLCTAVIYFLFLTWNGLFTNPLSEQEIEKYIEVLKKNASEDDLENNYSEGDLEEILSFMQEDDGKPIIMVNAIKLYDTPKIVNGKTFSSSEEALADYTSFVGPYLLKRGSYPIFSGTSLMDAPTVWGIENAKEWTTASLVRYKSRRVMMELSTDPVFQQFHDSKVAAMEKTMAFPVRSDIHLVNLSLFVGLFLTVIGLAISLFIVRRNIAPFETQ